jgi:hypothetical protein
MRGDDCFSVIGEGKWVLVNPLLITPDSVVEACTSAPVMRRIALLELFHPAGIVERANVFGENCPLRLLPEPDCMVRDRADLIVLAPRASECRAPGWLQMTIQTVDRQLAPEGIVYVLAPRRWRWAIERLLRNHGLQIETHIAHFPNWESSRYLVPLNGILAQYAFSKLMPIRLWRRHFGLVAIRLPFGEKLLSGMWPWTAFIARRPSDRSLFDWSFSLDSDVRRPRNAILSSSWRGQNSSVVLHRFSGLSPHPSAVIKIAWTIESDPDRVDEVETLARIGPSARAAGADVPETLWEEKIGGRQMFLQSPISGQSVAVLLASSPNRMIEIIERVTIWLERWNLATKVVRPLDRDLIDHGVLGPVAYLAPLLQHGVEYRDRLAEQCAGINVPVPLVAAHNDLTMWNLLLDERGNLGVVDWEAAREESFPLVDFFYAMVDAIVMAKGLARIDAFKACFAPRGAYGQIVRKFLMRSRRTLEIPKGFAELCLHACFLHHAMNEQRMREPSDPQPFLELIQWLALNQVSERPWVNESA